MAAGAPTGRPSTAIASRAGSTLMPVRATWPLTVTRPAATSVSACRRDATPARASARWMRIGSLTVSPLRDLRRVAQGDRELVGPRQLLEVSQRELLEEDRGRAVEQRPADSLAAPDDVDEPALVDRLENAADGDAADLLDLGAADRLPVGDDRQRLERGRRETLRARRELGALDRLGVLRARQDLPALADLHELDAVTIDLVVLADLVDRGLHAGRRR